MRSFKPRKDANATFSKRLRRKRTSKKALSQGRRVNGDTHVHHKERQFQEEDGNGKPRKDANATFENANVEREIPKKLTHKADVRMEALTSITRKDKVRKKMVTASQGETGTPPF